MKKSLMFDMTLSLVMILAMPASAKIQYTQESCEKAPYMITVHVQKVRSKQGLVTAVLYSDNPDDFLAKGKKLAKIRVPAKEGTVDVCVIAPNPGTYAMVVYHDENGNKKFDKHWIGFPIEGFGVSNNPPFFLAPPNYDEAAFPVTKSQTDLAIDLVY